MYPLLIFFILITIDVVALLTPTVRVWAPITLSNVKDFVTDEAHLLALPLFDPSLLLHLHTVKNLFFVGWRIRSNISSLASSLCRSMCSKVQG